jgi:hypothetical protein
VPLGGLRRLVDRCPSRGELDHKCRLVGVALRGLVVVPPITARVTVDDGVFGPVRRSRVHDRPMCCAGSIRCLFVASEDWSGARPSH